MKTFAQQETRTELLRRLRTVRPDSVRRWGKMSAHQMVCHVGDTCRMATGERAVSHATGWVQRTVVKWVALYAPLPWPAGIPTRPELTQEFGGTCPSDFAHDVAELEALLEGLAIRIAPAWPDHPIFGPMSHADWMRWAWLHTDHHLRQFGL